MKDEFREGGQGFERRRKELEDGQARLKSAQDELAVERARLEDRDKELGARLSQVDSPFGKLPVGVVEAIHLFPVVLVLWALVCSSVLADLAGIRGRLRDIHGRRATGGPAGIESDLALIAPLWIARAGPSLNVELRRAVLSAPALIFLLACGLIVYNWSISSGPAGSDSLDRWVYGGLYLAGGAGWWVAWRQVREVLKQT